MAENNGLTFPCQFPIKIMGNNHNTFVQTVQSILSQHINPKQQHPIKTRQSKDGNFLAITVTITAESQVQLDTLYQQLSACDEVKLVL